jgi:hypothetical protein
MKARSVVDGSVMKALPLIVGRSFCGVDLTASTFEATPLVERHGRFSVVRDDLVPGGTKARALYALMKGRERERVAYAGDRFGFGPIALAAVAFALGMDALIVFPDGPAPSSTIDVVSRFPNVKVIVDSCSLNQNQAFDCATRIAEQEGIYLFPIGFDTPEFCGELLKVVSSVAAPEQAWSLAGSGCLSRAMQRAWPATEVHAVSMGFPHVNAGKAIIHLPVESVIQTAFNPPPYPSAAHYDAKVWAVALELAADGALIWNVA